MSRLEEIKERYMECEHDYALKSVDIDWLIQQAERVEKLVDRRVKDIAFVKEMKEKNQRYKQALEFYADEDIYEEDDENYRFYVPGIIHDNGDKARQALEGESE